MINKRRSIEILNWDQARAQIERSNKSLCHLIDQMEPSKKHKLIKATYLYGDLIVDKGVTYLPNTSGDLIKVTNINTDKQIKESLSYSHIPLFIVTKGGNEVFIDNTSRIIPLDFFSSGTLLGLFETIDSLYSRTSHSKWSVSSGSRSVFILPKISEKSSFQRLRKHYNLSSTTFPKRLTDHWQVFKEIAQHPSFKQEWTNEVIFFPKNWIRNSKEDVKWELFKNYIFQQAWEQAQFAMDKVEQNLIMESFSEAITLRGLKPTPYIIDHVKHILSIAASKAPGFRPVNIGDTGLPVEEIQNALIDIYQLKNYLPTIMRICSLKTLNNHSPLYYSLNFPTLLTGSPIKKTSNTIMLDLRDIKQQIDTLINFSRSNKLSTKTFMSDINIDYFHTDEDPYKEIQLSDFIPKKDPGFLNDKKRFPNHEFCASSLFWRGCVQVWKKLTEEKKAPL